MQALSKAIFLHVGRDGAAVAWDDFWPRPGSAGVRAADSSGVAETIALVIAMEALDCNAMATDPMIGVFIRNALE